MGRIQELRKKLGITKPFYSDNNASKAEEIKNSSNFDSAAEEIKSSSNFETAANLLKEFRSRNPEQFSLLDAQIAAIEKEIVTEGLRLRHLKTLLLEERKHISEEIKNLENLSNEEIRKKEYFSQKKFEAEKTKRLTEAEVQKIQELTKTLEETPRVNISLISFFADFGFNHIDPLKFEELMLKVFQVLGFDGKLTPPSGDDGIDIILTDVKGIKVIAQCKRYAEQQNISPKDVR